MSFATDWYIKSKSMLLDLIKNLFKVFCVIVIIIVLYFGFGILQIIWHDLHRIKVIKVLEFDNGQKLYFKSYTTPYETSGEGIWLSEDKYKQENDNDIKFVGSTSIFYLIDHNNLIIVPNTGRITNSVDKMNNTTVSIIEFITEQEEFNFWHGKKIKRFHELKRR